jgi:curved DNA-binding protein CbpA
VGRDTYYDILGVPPTASVDEIKVKYRKLLLRIHPDLEGPAALFRQVQEAYETLSNPLSRAAYDRVLNAQGATARTPQGDSKARSSNAPHGGDRNSHWDPFGATRPPNSSASARTRHPNRTSLIPPSLNRHPAGTVAIVGAVLLIFGVVLGGGGIPIVLGFVALVISGVAGLGGRGAKEREAFQRSGMTAVDGMTGRQFEVLLEHFFANKGYRVARIGGRSKFGADLLLKDAHGRAIVQARRWTGMVGHDAVQQAVAAMAHYGAARALVVTSSNYSQHAVMVAKSNGVTLWNRATLAAELTVFRGQRNPSGAKRLSWDFQAGTRICLGFVVTVFVALVAARTPTRRRNPAAGRRR